MGIVMPRYPFSRVPSRPPYISRSSDETLRATRADPSTIVLLVGESAGAGVTRSLKYFARNRKHLPVSLDFYGNAWRDAVEVLVIVRNALVSVTNREIGRSRIGPYLFA